MPRAKRENYPGAWHHVMNRGIRCQKIFYHLLIRTPKGNLSPAMRHINGIYTQWFNYRRFAIWALIG